MGNLQKEALIAYEKIKTKRGEVTFIDAFVAGCDYMRDKTGTWNDKDDEIVSNLIHDEEYIQEEYVCDLSETIEWLEHLKERFAKKIDDDC